MECDTEEFYLQDCKLWLKTNTTYKKKPFLWINNEAVKNTLSKNETLKSNEIIFNFERKGHRQQNLNTDVC